MARAEEALLLMEIGGYAGKILHVDLTTGEVKKQRLDIKLVNSFIGGFGINMKLAYDITRPNIDPFSPENPIIIGAGPLVGSRAPTCSKMVATTKFPLTGAFAAAGSGCLFGCMLKRAGYDHVIINGMAEKPVYLKIFDDEIDICNAHLLWGKDIYKTTDALWKKHGRACSVISVGPAGERLVKYALTLIDKVNSCGKGGLGAVMGSKNLKAVVALGTKRLKVSNSKEFAGAVNRLLKLFIRDPSSEKRTKLGGFATFDEKLAFWPHKNWTAKYPENKAKELYGVDRYIKVRKARISCPSCPIGCKDVLEIREGEYKGLITYASSFRGRTENWGSRCDVGDLNRVVKCHDISNRLGICCHTASALIDFVVYLFEQGVINERHTDGLTLKRDFDTTVILLDKIARREGLGDVLAEGWIGAIERIGRHCEKSAVQIKGQNPRFDPRMYGLGAKLFSQVTNPRGASTPISPFIRTPTEALNEPDDTKKYCERIGVPNEAIDKIFTSSGLNIGRLTKYVEDWYSLQNCLGCCMYASLFAHFYDINVYAQLYSLATGIEVSSNGLRIAGEKAWNMLKAINVRAGFTRKDDGFPDAWFKPMRDLPSFGKELSLTDYRGPNYRKLLTREAVNKLLDDYYEERGWEVKSSIPSRQKLTSLGLKDIADDLEKLGHK